MKFTEWESGDRVAMRLYEVRNTDAVYWSRQHNSYVVVKAVVGCWRTADGEACNLVSINGAGEARWIVTSPQGNTTGDVDAADYFGLTWRGWE